MSGKIKVSRKFLADFDLIVKHYECTQDEIDWLKSKVREDHQSVSKSIEIVAENVRNGSAW